MWYRIFGANNVEPDHAAILEYLERIDLVRGRFHGDEAGWFHADLLCDDLTLLLDRYTADEEGIRAELNAWAAFVEAEGGPDNTWLMERLIQTQQLFTLQGLDTSRAELLCVALCKYLARATNGVYQIDDAGFYTMDGTLLWRETQAGEA